MGRRAKEEGKVSSTGPSLPTSTMSSDSQPADSSPSDLRKAVDLFTHPEAKEILVDQVRPLL